MEGLKDDARSRGVVFPEDAAKAQVLKPQTSMLAAKPRKSSEPPLIETTEFDVDWYVEQGNAGKSSGEIFGMMFPQTLVDGKQCWEILQENPDNKHDLDLPKTLLRMKPTMTPFKTPAMKRRATDKTELSAPFVLTQVSEES